MKLEDEIKQKRPFKSEIAKLILNIQFTSSFFSGIISEKLKPFGLSPQQYNVLRILKGNHPKSYCNQEITSRMLDKSSNATRIVDKLVEKKLVSRTEDSADRRLVNINITDTGIKLLKEIDKMLAEHERTMKPFNEEKAKLMNEWLDELRG
jgi:DNA-binding MarR family transcriptional regulator